MDVIFEFVEVNITSINTKKNAEFRSFFWLFQARFLAEFRLGRCAFQSENTGRKNDLQTHWKGDFRLNGIVAKEREEREKTLKINQSFKVSQGCPEGQYAPLAYWFC